ncbi:protein of unknown function [endosymbiont DhMRE of Dentiscutata heterogama]|uniref:hypothetical protein n=1 Tax=endosymbiont DhMRE of Dentiscutata heterogama TaxID=1609546 RepID=UPI000629D270|nr:hypothetical protein [endosymbiont DhMRE of Dentiscutata heterogama]CFW93278.1 protein of unknown function [endosymbiont DhMRE of Dentiscutata heterogama]
MNNQLDLKIQNLKKEAKEKLKELIRTRGQILANIEAQITPHEKDANALVISKKDLKVLIWDWKTRTQESVERIKKLESEE